MFQNVVPNLLIGLREGLEAALVVSILVAYLVKVGRRDRLPSVGAGVMVAVGVSLAFGAALSFTSASLAPAAQEAFGGVLSLVAVGFVTWMVFWMRRTARTLAGELRGRLDAALVAGAFAVAVTAFLAVAREGLETALFLWAAVQSTGGSSVGPLLGAAAGLAAAVALAWLLYRRAVRLNLSRFFTWTGAGLVLVAAGVCAYGVHDLQEAGWLPAGPVAFDLSRHVSADAWYAVLLRAIFNLHPTMTWLEVTAYLAYLVPVIWLFLHGRPRLQGALSPPAPVARSWRVRPTSAAVLGVGALTLALFGVAGGIALTAGGQSAAAARDLVVMAREDRCEYSGGILPAGTATLRVRNEGRQVTEVYVFAGDRALGEVENIGPGISRSLTVDLEPGRYEIACKPAMTGTGIRTPLVVTGGAAPAARDPRLAVAVERYRGYVRQQAAALVPAARALAAAIDTGD